MVVPPQGVVLTALHVSAVQANTICKQEYKVRFHLGN